MQKSKLFFLGLLLVGLPYYPILFSHESALLYRDLSNVILPFKVIWAEAFSALGRIPQWNPMHSGGANFISDPSVGPLYPLNVIFLLFQPVTALTLFLYLQHALMFTGFFLYLSRQAIRPMLVLVGALAITWSGVSMSAHSLPHLLGAQASVGFFLYFLSRSKTYLDIFCASLALAWPIYSGDPQYSYILGLLGLVMVAIHPRRSRAIFIFPLSLLAGAPQIFSTVHLLLSRKVEAPYSEMIPWSLHPLRLLEIFYPFPFGTSPDPANFWANFLVSQGGGAPFLFSLFVGSLFSFFFFFHLFLRRPWGWARKPEAFLLLAIFLFTLLALGSNSPLPLYGYFEKWVPFWQSFRYPERLSYWVILGFLLFALRGAEKLLRLKHCKKAIFFPTLFLGLVGLFFFLWLKKMGASGFPVVYALFALGIVVGSLLLPQAKTHRSWIFLSILCFELLPVSHRLLFKQASFFTEAKSFPWVEKILADQKKNTSLSGNRFYSLVQSEIAPSLSGKQSDVEAITFTTWASMKFYTPITWDIPVVLGQTILAPVAPAQILLAAGPAELSKGLNIYSARYLLKVEGDQLAAKANQDALPLAFIPKTVEAISSLPELLKRLQDPSWKERESALLETADSQAQSPAEIKSFSKNWDKISVSVLAKNKTWLVINESYDPQWTAKLGDLSLRTVRANGWAMAIEIPAGGAEIELQFRDLWFERGKLAFLVWLALFILFLSRDFFLTLRSR